MRQFSLFLRGTLILTAAGLLSRFLGFFYKIFLAQALGAEGMGIYQLIFPVFSVCHALTASGMETAVSRFTAFDKEKSAAHLYAGLSLSLTVSCAAALFLWSRAGFIATSILCEARCEPLLKILTAAVPLSAIHSCFAGFYLGRKKTGLPAAAQLLEQSVRIGTVWLLCSIVTSRGGAVTPSLAVFGLLSGEAASALFMLTFSSGLKARFGSAGNYLSRCRSLLGMALPLTANRLSLTILQSAEAVLIPLNLCRYGLSTAEALSMYGILNGMAMSFLLFPNAVTSSVSAMLLPVISEEQARGNKARISLTLEYTIQFGLVIGILCMGIFLRFGHDLGTLVFGEELAGQFLMTLAWICPVLYLTGNLHSILHGLGQTTATFLNQLSATAVRILFVLLLVPSFGIQGVLWGLLASQLLLCALGLCAVSPYLVPSMGLDALVLKPLLALGVSLGAAELLHHLFPSPWLGAEILDLIASVCLTAGGYFALLFASGIWKNLPAPMRRPK